MISLLTKIWNITFMVKDLDSENENEMLNKIEGMILDKLVAVHTAGTKSLNLFVSYLISCSLISSIGIALSKKFSL